MKQRVERKKIIRKSLGQKESGQIEQGQMNRGPQLGRTEVLKWVWKMKKQGHEMKWKLESHIDYIIYIVYIVNIIYIVYIIYIIYIVYIFTNKITNIDQSYVNRPKICIDEKESLLCK